jgi:bacterial/archaeal transporter family protein
VTPFLLAFVSALLIGTYEVARKAAVARDTADRMLVTATSAGAVALLPAVLLSYFLPSAAAEVGLTVRWLAPREHALVLAKALLVTGVWVCAYEAVRHLPLTIAAPLRATAPVLTLFGAILLYAERPALLEWVGMSIVLVGYLGFAWLGPKEGIDYLKSPWIALLGLGLVLSAASGLFDKYLLQRAQLPPTTLQFWFLAYGSVLQTALLWLRERGTPRRPFRVERLALLVGLLLVVADQFYLRALAIPTAMVSVIALVRRASVLVSFTLGGYVFREKLLLQKAAPLALILVGLALLAAA